MKKPDFELNRDELIERYLPRVTKQINAYVRRYQNQRPYHEDLIGEASLRLVEVVDDHLAGKIDNFPAYLRLTIVGAIADFLRKESLIPSRSQKHQVVVVFGETAQLVTPPVPDMTYEEAFDKALHTIKGPRDATIFQRRWDGLTIRETAAKMGVSRQTVIRRLKKMRERYEQQTAKDELRVDKSTD